MKWTIWFFGICALLTLGVSIPATYDALRIWHDNGSAYGWVLAVFALLVFEVGAVGAKLATLAIPEWRGRLTVLTIGLLSITTAANYAHGYDLSQAADASPTLAAVLHSPLGAVLATLATAALFPALLFVFLSAFVSRWEADTQARQQPTVTATLTPPPVSAPQAVAAVQVHINPPAPPRFSAAGHMLPDVSHFEQPSNAIRRWHLRTNGGWHSRREWLALCQQFGYRCAACGEGKPLTKDHVVPLSAGGRNSIDNLQPLCQACNSSKGRKVIDYRADALERLQRVAAGDASAAVVLTRRDKVAALAAEMGISQRTVWRKVSAGEIEL